MGDSETRRFRVPRWSVRSRVLTSILVVAALGMITAGATSFLIQRERVIQEVDELLQSRIATARFAVLNDREAQSTQLADTIDEEALAPLSSRDALAAIVGDVIPTANESSLGIIDGRPTFHPPVAVAFSLDEDPEFITRVVEEVSDGTVRLGSAVTPMGNLRYIATTVDMGDAGPQAIYLTAISLDSELNDLSAVFGTFALVAAGSLVIIGLVGWLVAGRLLAPLRQLRIAASRITASDRRERIPVVGRDDLSDLTGTINDMLDRLDVAITSQHQLLDDVRHELKTPITIVRGNLELLDADDASDVRAVRALAIDELDRMAGLVDDIEVLAESQIAVPHLQPTDVEKLTRDVFAKARGISGHEWSLASVAEWKILLDPARITQAWLQLVDNAAKFSPTGSTVELGSTTGDGSIEFWVKDAGPGVAAEAQERIFERFGRVESTRGVEGSGLGLAIVRLIAATHGGRVALESSSAGSRFSIVIPRVMVQSNLPGSRPVAAPIIPSASVGLVPSIERIGEPA